jgi:sigma-E factor negative regulatory protein RseA
MSAESPDPDRDELAADDPRRWVSAAADGEAAAADRAAALWRNDARAREAWHLYHLIGDVLRSDDLACPPQRSAAFVRGLRERLAVEPVPLAPPATPMRATPGSSLRRLGWRAPAAVAAGFVAVAAVVVLVRPDVGARGFGAEATLAAASRQPAGSAVAPSGPAVVPASVAGPGLTVPSLGDSRMIRDARLDAYLRAHQAARGGAPVALPGGAVRSVEMLLPPETPQLAASAREVPGRSTASVPGR